MPSEATPARRSSTMVVEHAHSGAGAFNIFGLVPKPRKVGRNYVARSPSWAEAGN